MTPELPVPHDRDRLALEERARILETVDRIARHLATQQDLRRLAHAVCEAVQDALGAAGASVLLRGADGLRFVGATGPAAPGLLGGTIPEGKGAAGEVIRSGGAVLVRGARPGPDWVEAATASFGFSVQTLVAAPLLVDGKLLGVVEAVNRAGSSEPFGPHDLDFLERLAPHVAAAVANASLAEELRRSRDELARQNELLEERVVERTGLLAAAKDEWELTFDSMSDPLVIVEGGTIRRANLAFARAIGREIREVPGLRCAETCFCASAPCPGCAPSPAGSSPADREVHLGERIFVRHASPLNDPLRPLGWVVAYREVTGERLLEAQLREAEQQAAIARLAAGAAHEINNPMAFLTAALRTLRDYVGQLGTAAALGARAAAAASRGDDEEANRTLRSIGEHAEGLQLGELVDDAQSVLAEGEEGARRITAIVKALRILGPEETRRDQLVDLAELLGHAAESVRRSHPFGGTVRWGRQVPARVLGNPLQLEQALVELIRNAAQAAGDGTIELATWEQDGRVGAEVRDSGPGLSDEVRPYVFEPFFTSRGVGRGIGLGLTIAYGVARRHGGSVTLENAPEHGALARLTLPAAAAALPVESAHREKI